MNCPNCNSTKVVKDGQTKQGKRRFRCKNCSYRWVENASCIKPRWTNDEIEKLKKLYLDEKLHIDEIVKKLGRTRLSVESQIHELKLHRPDRVDIDRTIKKICPVCGREFFVGGKTRRHKNKTYCSIQCANIARQKDTGYRAWQRFREQVWKRDNYQCVICKRKKSDGYKIEAHHIIPRKWVKASEFKGEEKLSDCITVCAQCHGALERLTKAAMENKPDFDTWKLLEALIDSETLNKIKNS